MKSPRKLIFALIWALLNAHGLLAQWNPGTTPGSIYYDAGNVGIGIAQPGSKLHINAPATNGLIVSGNSSSFLGADVTISRSGTTSGVGRGATLQFTDGGANTQHIIQGSSAGLQFFNTTSNTWSERMRIDNAGNVGIGTLNPQSKLDIAVVNGTGLNVAGNYASFVGADINIIRWSTGTGVGQGATIQLNDFNAQGGGFNIIQSTAANLQFFRKKQNAGWLESMRITDDGRVGIGSTSPDALLTVNGDIHTREVRVDMDVPGPDYVFEKDYNLLSLAELEAYISQNKHLPEVPSAREMEANGLNLKEMNLLLLKKVEELTLHLIEVKKEVEKLKKGVDK